MVLLKFGARITHLEIWNWDGPQFSVRFVSICIIVFLDISPQWVRFEAYRSLTSLPEAFGWHSLFIQ